MSYEHVIQAAPSDPTLKVALQHLAQMVREHERSINFIETHSSPHPGDPQPPCLTRLHNTSGAAGEFFETTAVAAQKHQDTDPAATLLPCVSTLVESLCWILQPTGTPMEEVISPLQSRLATDSQTAVARISDAVVQQHLRAWLRDVYAALNRLVVFVIANYPRGVWYGHHNRREIARHRRLRHPADVGDAPFEAVLRVSGPLHDEDVEQLSAALLAVSQAHTACLDVVRRTPPHRSAEQQQDHALFAPLNAALDRLSAACEGVIARREDARTQAHAVLEAGNLFTWLTATSEPCVVVEEAFGSADLYLTKTTSRGNVLLQQHGSNLTEEQQNLAKAAVVWASTLRDALRRLSLMVSYRYPRSVPWGEEVEAPMERRSDADQGSVPPTPLWCRPQTSRSVSSRGTSVRLGPNMHSVPSSAPPRHAKPSSISEEEEEVEGEKVASKEEVVADRAPPQSHPEASIPPKPSCRYDANSSTWVVEHYSQQLINEQTGEEQDPVFVTLPEETLESSHRVSIRDCLNTYVTVPSKVKSIVAEDCRLMKLQVAGVEEAIRFSSCERQEVLIETAAHAIHATQVQGLTIHMTGSTDIPVFTSSTTNVNITVMAVDADGEPEVRELALPEQYISTIQANDAVVTQEVKHSG